MVGLRRGASRPFVFAVNLNAAFQRTPEFIREVLAPHSSANLTYRAKDQWLWDSGCFV